MIAIATAWLGRTLSLAPRWLWLAVAGAFATLLLLQWHHRRVDAAFAAGVRVQAASDSRRVAAAAATAAAVQAATVKALVARQDIVSKGASDALLRRNADLARRYDDLRLRWAAARADPGGTGEVRSIAVPGATAGADDTACAAAGWVSFDTAAAAAEAADTAIAKDDAWIAWAAAQQAVWRKQ